MLVTSFFRAQCLTRICTLTASLVLCQSALAASLEQEPFWQASVGYWSSENTYMDGQYKPKIPHYQTLNAIATEGDTVTSEERKFYPPGAFAAKALGLDIPEDKGVQLVQVTRGVAKEDASHVEFAPLNRYSHNQRTWLDSVSEDSAMMTVAYKDSGEIAYKMLITVPTANSRITASLGINGHYAAKAEETPLRGVSVFSATRITQQDFEELTQQLQQQYQVGSIVTIDEQGNYQASPIK
ncbi:hypothetical protein [Alteromonas lipolytica]|nr:hypothetical protein [Alteromonas lipolytica]GGF60065.1 hypothetical protein GCM10011338_10420 [Alteromonas lipolytica]